MEYSPAPAQRSPRLLGRLRRWVTDETNGGALLLGAAVLSLLWANSPWHASHAALSGTVVGPSALHLDLTLATWASDGLLAIFFLVVGVELKQEFVTGALRDLRAAAVPVLAAVGGMATPAVVFSLTVWILGEPSALHGWAVPTATDIAFALGVLSIFGRGLPGALRTFLLTLAVVDDLLAIIVIAAFYTEGLDWLALACSLVSVVVFALVVRARILRPWLLVPLAVVAWAFMHASGVHPTIAGVLLGLSVPATALHGERQSRTEAFRKALAPVSAGLVLPVFAFFAAGVSLPDDTQGAGPLGVVEQPVFLAVLVALVLGKFIGVMGTTALVTRLTPLRIPGGLGLRDLLPVGLLTGIGFTVSLLIADLSFPDSIHTDGAKIAVLSGSLVSALLGAAALRCGAHRERPA